MKKVVSFFTIVCISSFFYQCSTKASVDPGDDPTVIITDIWFSNFIDNDNDGFSSSARLNFDLDTNVDDFSVVVKIGIRHHSDVASDLYVTYLQSKAFTISGETTSDAVSFEIGGSNSELDEGNYDILIQVYAESDLLEVIAQGSPTTYSELDNVKFEYSSQDVTGVWISYIDDGIFESSYIIPARPPLGVSYGRLTEKFEKPANAGSYVLKKVRVHVPQINNPPGQLTISIYGGDDNEPGELLHTTNTINISTTGWNTYDLEYDLTNHDVFYISVPPSQNYAISIDNNSAILNGYVYESVSSNPPREGWVKENLNYAIEVFLEY